MQKETTKSRGRPSISDDKRQVMRNKIAVATNKMFEAQGYRQISMRSIARDVGCSPMTLYKYYESKIEILHTLWSDIFEEVFKQLYSAEQNEASPQKRLSILAKTYIRYWLNNTDHYRLVFMTEGVNQNEVSTFIDTPKIFVHYKLFAKTIAEIFGNQLPEQDLKLKLDALLCFLHGITHNKITISGYNWASDENLVEIAIRAILEEK